MVASLENSEICSILIKTMIRLVPKREKDITIRALQREKEVMRIQKNKEIAQQKEANANLLKMTMPEFAKMKQKMKESKSAEEKKGIMERFIIWLAKRFKLVLVSATASA